MKKLTNYDKYVLAKKNSNKCASDFCEVNGNVGNEYDEYLLNELRRTTPSTQRVLREDEYYEMKRSGNSSVLATGDVKEKNSRFRLRKGGKILLTIYVILMLALALILIVSNTARDTSYEGISFNQSAGAASSEDSDSDKKTVRAMTLEEDSGEETNWFDKLCDSLNK